MYMEEYVLGKVLECLADVEIAFGDSKSGPGKMVAQLSEPLRKLYHDVDDNDEVSDALDTLRNRNWR